MGFLKKLFGGSDQPTDNKKKENDNKQFDTLKYDGVRALRQGQSAFAVQCFTHALQLKNDLECRDYLSQAYIHTDQLPLAAEQLQILTEAQPDNISIFIRLAEVYFMAENYENMATTCIRAMELDKENTSVLFAYARACNGQGNTIQAIALLTKAITLKDDFAEARLMRADLLLKMGDANGAEEDAKMLQEQCPDNEDILLLVARIYEAKAMHNEAIEAYCRVLDVNPFCLAAFKERGAIRMATGDSKGASEDMKQVLELDSNTASNISGEYSAEGIESKVKAKYRSMDPYGIFSE